MEMNQPRDKEIQAIRYGLSCAIQLKKQLGNPTVYKDGLVSSYDLAKSIVDCLTNVVSNLSDNDKFSDLSSRDSFPLHPLISNSKKRKNTSSSENWRDDSPDPIYYDGFLWTKYGQKCIKNNNHQRSYYRCVYNKYQNCEAKKHEQKIKDNPPVYRTTYFGHHICKVENNQDVILKAVFDPVEDLKSAQMIQFGKDIDHSGGFSLSVKHDEDFVKKDQRTGFDQDFQHMVKENLSSSSLDSYHHQLSSRGNESAAYNPDLLWHNLDSWDFDHLDEF